jgi:hypothetical protein
MFGKHLEPAEATVLYAEICSTSTHASWQIYEFILDVRTATGQVFRAKKKQEFIPFTHPKAGDVIKVKYNPKNLKVELDLKGDLRFDTKAQDAATKARHNAILASQPGTPLPPDPYQEALRARFHSGAGAGAALNLNELLSNALTNGATVIQMGGNGQTFTSAGSQDQGGQAQAVFMQNALLRAVLQNTGATGTATIQYIEETGMSFPPFIAQKVTARVQEAANYQVFDCTFTAWVDTRREQLYIGISLPVRYDPSNHDKIIFQH